MTNSTADQQDTRRINRQLRWMLPLIVIVFALVVGIKWGQTIEQPADVTALPCTAWTATSSPDIPAYTLTDRCVDADGTIVPVPQH